MAWIGSRQFAFRTLRNCVQSFTSAVAHGQELTEMQITITIQVPSGELEEEAVLETIEMLLDESHADYTWEESE
jgi:hypothetical protein